MVRDALIDIARQELKKTCRTGEILDHCLQGIVANDDKNKEIQQLKKYVEILNKKNDKE